MSSKKKISIEDAKKINPSILLLLIDRMKNSLKKDEVIINMFKEYNIDLNEFDLIPMAFADIDVSAKCDHGIIFFNYALLCDGDFKKNYSYCCHEVVHWIQQTSGDKPTKGADDGDYLHNKFEQEGFQNQIEFISNHYGIDEAKEYVENLLEHHDKDGKEKDKLEKILLERV